MKNTAKKLDVNFQAEIQESDPKRKDEKLRILLEIIEEQIKLNITVTEFCSFCKLN